MSSIRAIEKRCLEDFLGMSGGYVLDFTNSTFAEFFRENVQKDIYSDRYAYNGDSKAKRLRAFWEQEPDTVVATILNGMVEIAEYNAAKDGRPMVGPLYDKVQQLIAQLSGGSAVTPRTETEFLKTDYGSTRLDKLQLESDIVPILEDRIKEAEHCIGSGSPLSAIFMCGSVLEGILLGMATRNPRAFNQATGSPKDKNGKVRQFHEWSLSNFINVAHELGVLQLDVKKFSHELRDFRNYIHPYQQMASRFTPNKHTAEICYHVLKACIFQLSGDKPD